MVELESMTAGTLTDDCGISIGDNRGIKLDEEMTEGNTGYSLLMEGQSRVANRCDVGRGAEESPHTHHQPQIRSLEHIMKHSEGAQTLPGAVLRHFSARGTFPSFFLSPRVRLVLL